MLPCATSNEETALFDDMIDSKIKAFQSGAGDDKWMASLPFQGFMCMVTDPVPCAGDPCYQQSVDLFRDGVNATALHNCMIRFDPGKYNPAGASSNFADQQSTSTNSVDHIWEKAAVGGRLITALFEASHQQAGSGGCSLLSNGSKCRKGSRTTNHHRFIYCNHYRKYDDSSKVRKAIEMKKNKAGQSEPRGPFRRMTFCNNKKNSRPKGQSMIRRTTTFRPLSLVDGTCKVRTNNLSVLY